ncbi:unnamed protein product, partial [Candidula unifasciata]
PFLPYIFPLVGVVFLCVSLLKKLQISGYVFLARGWVGGGGGGGHEVNFWLVYSSMIHCSLAWMLL